MFAKKVYAQLDASDLGVQTTVGNISNFREIFIWAFNLFKWLGWAGVIVGVGFSIMMAIFAITASDQEEAFEKFRIGITRAVLIVIMGILLLSAGFFIKVVGGLVGVDIAFDLPLSL